MSCADRTVYFADNVEITADNWEGGDLFIPVDNCITCFREALFIPAPRCKLASTGRLASKSIESDFRPSGILLRLESNSTPIEPAWRDVENRMYLLPSPITKSALASSSLSDYNKKLWHRWLTRINIKDLINVHKSADDVAELKATDDVWRACEIGIAHQQPLTGHFCWESAVGIIMHSDIVEKLALSYSDNYRYVCNFRDDQPGYTSFAFLRDKSALHDAL